MMAGVVMQEEITAQREWTGERLENKKGCNCFANQNDNAGPKAKAREGRDLGVERTSHWLIFLPGSLRFHLHALGQHTFIISRHITQ